jgi:tripartite-type tricarboxylate transporter receptor subunit TctC
MNTKICSKQSRKITVPASGRTASRLIFRALACMVGCLVAEIIFLQPTIAAEAVEKYPSGVIRIIVPFPPGGTADALPRIVADKLREKWGQPVVIDNRSGAGGNIGAELVAKSEPDGYTLLASPPGPIAINEALYKELAFNPSDLEPATLLGSVPNVLAVRPNFPAKTAYDFVQYVKANPGKVTYASQGIGSTSHLAGVLFEKQTNSTMVHVPYRGSAPALQDIMADQVDVIFDNLASSFPLNEAHKLRILAVGSPMRVSSLPEVPTVQEAGVPGFESTTWFAVMAAPKTSAALIERLNKAITEILAEPDVKSRFAAISVQPIGGTVAQTKKFIAEERLRWGSIIRDANIQAE